MNGNEEKKATNRWDYEGEIYEILPEKVFASGFKKRDFVCKTTNGEYTDLAVFTAKKDLADTVGALKKGTRVRVSFALSGRAWDNPETHVTRWFGECAAFRVAVLAGAEGLAERSSAITTGAGGGAAGGGAKAEHSSAITTAPREGGIAAAADDDMPF